MFWSKCIKYYIFHLKTALNNLSVFIIQIHLCASIGCFSFFTYYTVLERGREERVMTSAKFASFIAEKEGQNQIDWKQCLLSKIIINLVFRSLRLEMIAVKFLKLSISTPCFDTVFYFTLSILLDSISKLSWRIKNIQNVELLMVWLSYLYFGTF